MFGENVNNAIREHAREEFPKECCGIVSEGAYVPFVNTHEDPYGYFEITREAVWHYFMCGKLQAIAHSHPKRLVDPSLDDQKCQLSTGLPWGVVSVEGQVTSDIVWWGPGAPVMPFVGRKFVVGVWDCYSLATDYYAKRGINLQPVARDREWVKNGGNLFLDNLEASGFTQIDRADLVVGDGVLMRIAGSTINHCAVYTGNGLILHHIIDRLSREEPLLPLLKFVTHYLRSPQ